MKKEIIGFFIGCIFSCFAFVYILENIHIVAERRADVKWCVWMDEAIFEKFGEPAREIFYISYKIFRYPLKGFFVYSSLDSEIKFYPSKED